MCPSNLWWLSVRGRWLEGKGWLKSPECKPKWGCHFRNNCSADCSEKAPPAHVPTPHFHSFWGEAGTYLWICVILVKLFHLEKKKFLSLNSCLGHVWLNWPLTWQGILLTHCDPFTLYPRLSFLHHKARSSLKWPVETSTLKFSAKACI